MLKNPLKAALVSAPLSITPALAQASNNQDFSGWIWLLAALAIAQTLTIAGLQKSRVKYKRARNELEQAKSSLEARISERTESLRTSNHQLTDVVAKHEVTEELLREAQNYLHSTINSMPSVLIGVSRQGNITLWNAAAERLIGVGAQQALGKLIADVCPELPVPQSTIAMAIDTNLPQTLENQQQGVGSQAHYSDITVYPLTALNRGGAVIRIDDVTLRVRVENMMIQNEKMASLGELAAGMAHEINNPMAAILNNVQNISRRTDPSLEMNKKEANKHNLNLADLDAYLRARDIPLLLNHIREAGERSAHIVSNMLEFSRNNYRNHSKVDLRQLLDNAIELAANSAPYDTQTSNSTAPIKTEYATDLPLVNCSAIEIQQVILNLLRNAWQAFKLKELPAQTAKITLRAYCKQSSVCIEVEDNGPGMTDTVKRHIFEPFFTTKEVGKGTGLGLSVSYFIITEHHGGTITVDSSPERGTLFSIELPI